MSFTQGDKIEMQALLSKAAAVADTIGQIKRDFALVRRLNPQWDPDVSSVLIRYENMLLDLLMGIGQWESTVVDLINIKVPQEDS